MVHLRKRTASIHFRQIESVLWKRDQIPLANNGMVPSGWILLVGGLWMAQLMTYQCMAYHLDHGRKKGGR